MYSEGTVIGGKYRLESLIGEGGMGTVWRATHTDLGRTVAVKFIHMQGANARTAAQRFIREARVAASVRHRNVVDILDVGIFDGAQPYMVMELLEGRGLDQRFATAPRLTTQQAVAITSLSLRGLAAVHDAGIVHRDLKPENVFLVRDADGVFPKLLDFGVSRVYNARDPEDPRSKVYTTEGLIVGTPRYMSPEQARGLPDIDKRTDIYSIGAILYEALAGFPPFDAEHVGDLLIKITTTDAVPLLRIRPDVGSALSDTVRRAMMRDRAKRFQDAREMRESLAEALQGTFQYVPGTGQMPRISESEIPEAFGQGSGSVDRASPTPEAELAVERTDHNLMTPQALAMDVTTASVALADELINEIAPSEPPIELQELPASEPPAARAELLGSEPPTAVRAPLPTDVLAPPALFEPGVEAATSVDERADDRIEQAPAVITKTERIVGPSGHAARAWVIAAAAAVGVAAAVVGAATWRLAGRGAATTTQVASMADEIVVALRGAPVGATLRVDGEERRFGPLRFPRDARTHRIEVRAAGYAAWVRDVSARTDATLDVVLAPVRSTVAAGAPNPPAKIAATGPTTVAASPPVTAPTATDAGRPPAATASPSRPSHPEPASQVQQPAKTPPRPPTKPPPHSTLPSLPSLPSIH